MGGALIGYEGGRGWIDDKGEDRMHGGLDGMDEWNGGWVGKMREMEGGSGRVAEVDARDWGEGWEGEGSVRSE